MERIWIFVITLIVLTSIEAMGQTYTNRLSTPAEEPIKQQQLEQTIKQQNPEGSSSHSQLWQIVQQRQETPLHIIVVHDQEPQWRTMQSPTPPPAPAVLTEAQILESQKQQEKEQQKLLDEQKASKQVDLKEMAHTSRTFYVRSDTMLVDRNQVIGEVRNRDGFKELDLVLVDTQRIAEIVLTVDYIPWTFDYTFKAVDQKTSVVLVSGKITAFNGYFAAMELAHSFVGKLKAVQNMNKVKNQVKTDMDKPTAVKITDQFIFP